MIKNNQTHITTSFFQRIALIFLGLFFAIIILEMGLRLGGVALLSLRECRNYLASIKKGTYRIICLGESTTYAGGSSDSYPTQLEEVLNQMNLGKKFSVINKGLPAQDTNEIFASLDGFLNDYKPDMVICMMGINDVSRYLRFENRPGRNFKFSDFIDSLRVVRLARLIKAHIIAKNLIRSSYAAGETHSLPNVSPIREEKVFKKDWEAPVKVELTSKTTQNTYEYYLTQGRFIKSEEMLKKAIAICPEKVEAYEELAELYKDLAQLSGDTGKAENLKKAEAAYKKAIELEPKNYRLYSNLGYVFMLQGTVTEAEEVYDKAIKLDPYEVKVYTDWGWWEYISGRVQRAEEIFKEAINLMPEEVDPYNYLGRLYLEKGNIYAAEAMYKESLKRGASYDYAYGGLVAVYIMMQKFDMLKEHDKKVKQFREEFYNPVTYDNYYKIKKTLDERVITLVCVQYPMRSIEPLKLIFQDQRGVIFVDNENVFKQAVIKGSYREYFTDMFGGDFGHCTKKGYRLLAENIAKTISKDIFRK